jgi:pimeloyl-ACP methyl ester carboxylesterase
MDASVVAPDAGPLLSDESVLALATTHKYIAGGYLKDFDAPVLEETMRAAYARMRDEELIAPRAPGRLEKIAIPGADEGLLVLAGEARDRGAIIFLHGWGGRWALPCWQIARVVTPLGMTTACPDLGLSAEWWSRDGERVVKSTADALRAAGHKTLVLAGLSNGAAGASRLPARMAGTFVSVILVSGADPAAPSTSVPTLVLHGRRDQMTPFEAARTYGRRPGARLVPLEAGHFAMLVNAATAEQAIADFLAPPQ